MFSMYVFKLGILAELPSVTIIYPIHHPKLKLFSMWQNRIQ